MSEFASNSNQFETLLLVKQEPARLGYRIRKEVAQTPCPSGLSLILSWSESKIHMEPGVFGKAPTLRLGPASSGMTSSHFPLRSSHGPRETAREEGVGAPYS